MTENDRIRTEFALFPSSLEALRTLQWSDYLLSSVTALGKRHAVC